MSALIGYGRPDVDDIIWAISGTGASFDTDPAKLNSGRVAERTAVQWLSGAQSLSSVLELQCTWSTPQPVRIIPLLDLAGIPAGTKIVVTGKRVGDTGFPYPLGGNSATQRTVQLADGSVGMWIICAAGNTDLIGYQVAIYNDVNGTSSPFTAGQFIYPGEIDAFRAWESPANTAIQWGQQKYNGAAIDTRSGLNQPNLRTAQLYRTWSAKLGNVDYGTAFGVAGAPTILDTLLVESDVCCYIPRWQDAAGLIDPVALHRHSIYGVAQNIQFPTDSGSERYELAFDIAQSPPGQQ